MWPSRCSTGCPPCLENGQRSRRGDQQIHGKNLTYFYLFVLLTVHNFRTMHRNVLKLSCMKPWKGGRVEEVHGGLHRFQLLECLPHPAIRALSFISFYIQVHGNIMQVSNPSLLNKTPENVTPCHLGRNNVRTSKA